MDQPVPAVNHANPCFTAVSVPGSFPGKRRRLERFSCSNLARSLALGLGNLSSTPYLGLGVLSTLRRCTGWYEIASSEGCSRRNDEWGTVERPVRGVVQSVGPPWHLPAAHCPPLCYCCTSLGTRWVGQEGSHKGFSGGIASGRLLQYTQVSSERSTQPETPSVDLPWSVANGRQGHLRPTPPGAMALSSDPATLEDQYGLPEGLSSEEGQSLALQTQLEKKARVSCRFGGWNVLLPWQHL